MHSEIKRFLNECTYFHTLILQILSTINDDVSHILTFRSDRDFNPYLTCAAESIDFCGVVPTLKHQCLRYLHFNLNSKMLLPNKTELFADFRPQPVVIKYLNIPKSLKIELLRWYLNCPRHFLLHSVQPRKFTLVRYCLHAGRELYIELQSNPAWDKNLNAKVFHLAIMLCS